MSKKKGGNMLYFVTTKKGQGQRKNDFAHTENEPAIFGMQCDGERIDGFCGCRRSFVGVPSAKSSTTATVKEVDAAKVKRDIAEHFIRAWKTEPKEAKEWAEEQFNNLQEAAQGFRAGDVVERRGDQIITRRVA